MMKKLLPFLALAGLLLISPIVRAQDEIEDLLKESVQDGTKLIQAYIDPAMKAVSLSMNQGWYNTAKPHKIAGFDLTITANVMYIPDDDLLFDATKLGLQQVAVVSPSNGKLPTIFGSETDVTLSPAATTNDPVDDFDLSLGLNIKEDLGRAIVPVPMAQLGFGLPKGTDLKIRFVPKLDLGDNTQFNVFGLGVMHDVKQYIPGIKNLPFDLSGFVGFTKMKLEADLDGNSTENQKGSYTINSTTIQGLISKKFSVLTLYGSLGYNIAKSNLGMTGNYDLDGDGSNETKDPVNLDFKASGLRASAGLRLKFAVFTFHADYTLAKYKCLSAGFGINVR